ncbi:putative chromosome-partitioning protein ParB [compost metagenome]
MGRSRASVSNLLRLIDLPIGVRVLLETRRLEMGHARALLTLAPELATKLAEEAADEGWSVREVEHRAQQFAAGKVPGARKAKPSSTAPQADIASLETELSESLGTKVAISHGRGGKGKLVIHYTDLDTLEGVLERLRTRQQG